MPDGHDDFCLIGFIKAPHGIHGEVSVQSYSDIPGRFSLLSTVHVGRSPAALTALTVGLVRVQSHTRIILRFKEFRSRTDVKQIIGMNLYITNDHMMPPPSGRFYVHELIGSSVVNEQGKARGVVRDVWLLKANDVYVVDYEGREILLPAVPEVIARVDVPQRIIHITEIPGLYTDDED